MSPAAVYFTALPTTLVRTFLIRTSPPLDRLFYKGLIADSSYRAGIRIRTLFCRIYGASQVRAYDISHVWGIADEIYSEEEMRYFQRQLHLAMLKLEREKCHKAVMDLCVYDIPLPTHPNTGYFLPSRYLDDAKNGLKILAKHWKMI